LRFLVGLYPHLDDLCSSVPAGLLFSISRRQIGLFCGMWLVSGQPDRWWSADSHAKAISRSPQVSDSRRGAMSDVTTARL